MASEAILKQLFEVAKGSLYFKGLSDAEIWQACLEYRDRSEDDIEMAMENIRSEDEKIKAHVDHRQEVLEQNKQRMAHLHHEEEIDRQEDEKNAATMLDDIFNL